MSTRFLIIDGGKGGIGKTTFAQNLAYDLALIGRRVGLFDTDKQAMSTNLVDVEAVPKGKWHTITEVIRENVPIIDAMYQARPGLWVVPSNTNIESAAKHILVEEAQEVMVDRIDDLLAAFKPAPTRILPWQQKGEEIRPRDFNPLPQVTGADVLARPEYLDYVIFDFGGDPGALGRAIRRIGFSHPLEIWAPVALEPMPMQGFAQMVLMNKEMFKKHPDRQPPVHVIPFKVNHTRAELTTENLYDLYRYYPNMTMRSVHDNGLIPKSQKAFPAQTVFEHQRSSRPAKEIFELALRVDGYTASLEGNQPCEICQEIRQVVLSKLAPQTVEKRR